MSRLIQVIIATVVAVSVLAPGVMAHEVRPAIADLTQTDSEIALTITLNAEAFVAGVDLDGVTDTNETDASDTIDSLRALDPLSLTEKLKEFLPDMIAALNVRSGDELVALTANSIVVPEIGDVELPRDTVLDLIGQLPNNAKTLEIDWPAQYGALVLRQQGVEEPYTGYLAGGEGSGPIALTGGDAAGAVETFVGYIPVGFDHILPKGLDHILFVLGLFFLSTSFRTLLWQVSAFTLAHTVTLALGALGYVTIPGSIVEPLIAASIVYVAVENVVSDKLHKWRPFVIFGFGLLHGLGFASVLGEFGLPQAQFIPALIGFNIGVEIGQLTVIALAFLVVYVAQRVDRGDSDEKFGLLFYIVLVVVFVVLGVVMNTDGFALVMGAGAPIFFWPIAGIAALCALSAYELDKLDAYRQFVTIPASLAIALVGAYWFIERVFL